MIALALPYAGNFQMDYLAAVWKEYIEPTFAATCNACYDRVLKNYRALQQTFIDLKIEEELLLS